MLLVVHRLYGMRRWRFDEETGVVLFSVWSCFFLTLLVVKIVLLIILFFSDRTLFFYLYGDATLELAIPFWFCIAWYFWGVLLTRVPPCCLRL